MDYVKVNSQMNIHSKANVSRPLGRNAKNIKAIENYGIKTIENIMPRKLVRKSSIPSNIIFLE